MSILRSRPLALLLRSLRGLHRDTRGAVSVLVLLTLWCLLAIVGLVWNTMENAKRRQEVQTAADSAAHAAATWLARSHNAITAQNMVISQDAATEVIWRAVPPTDQVLTNRLTGEITQAQQMKQQQTLQQMQRRLQDHLLEIASTYQLAGAALANLESGAGANYADAEEARDYRHRYRGARSVMNWVQNTYVDGAAPSPGDPQAPLRPGPPGPNGEGLAQVVAAWQPTAEQDAILDTIIDFINQVEMPILVAFRERTAPATSQPVDLLMAEHQAHVFQNQLAMVNALPVAVELQRAQLAEFHRTDITLATLKNGPGFSGPSFVTASLVPASMIPVHMGHVDSIRMAFPLQTQQASLSPVVDIDPMSPHTGPARIWHPDLPAVVPEALRMQYPTLAPVYGVSANFPNGWGHNWAVPLERYIHQRVNNDQREINDTYMVVLDNARVSTLAAIIRSMLGLPNNGNIAIANLPGTLPDDQPHPPPPPPPPPATLPGQTPPPVISLPPTFDQLPVLPRLAAPPNASAAFRTQVDLYNQHGAAYTGAVRRLRTSLIAYTAFFDRFTRGFASEAWHTQVNAACITVLEKLGRNKQFMVLATYGLRPIPQWAQPGMFDSAVATIENHIVQVSMQSIADTITRDLSNSDPRSLGAAYLDSAYRQTLLYGAYVGNAAAIAQAIVRPVAHQIAINLANEWIRRPWPFEIEPPPYPVPPFRGILPDDRKLHFTVLAAARQTPATAPRLIQLRFDRQDVFSSQTTSIVAYAQAEAFNWMEFNATYGGGERFDQIVRIPDVTYRGRSYSYTGFVGSPRAWRVNTIGGWNWRSRLSLADALYPALELNGEFREYLRDAGVTHYDEALLHEVNLH